MEPTTEIKVTITEQPGAPGQQKSAALAHYLQSMLADRELLASVEARIEQRKEGAA